MRSYRSLAASVLLCSLDRSSAFTLPQNNNHAAVARTNTVQLHSDSSSSSKQTPAAGMDIDESSEYEYNEADFAEYSSDYSDVDDADDDDDDIDIDLITMDDLDPSELDLYDDYDDIGGYNLSPFEKHARDVFLTYAEQVQSTLDLDSDNLSSDDNEVCEDTQLANAAILKKDLYSMLQTLDIGASQDESEALFKYLDEDGDGRVTLDEFLPWYAEAIDASQQVSIGFQNLVKSRRTVHKFDDTEVDDGVLRRALECAIAAPNRRGTEPWRFIKLGKQTVGKIVKLRDVLNNKSIGNSREDNAKRSSAGVDGSFVSWTKVPHWIVVTYTKAPPDSGPDGKMQQREDFKSTCCAVQNFLLSMWSEGIGTKWTDGPIQRTEEFAKICGIDMEKEKVAGVIWYGFARGGLNKAQAKERRKGVEEVLDILP
ncbi:hypothetical protein ACHAXR_003632 [Thalassiosira sp. AJA248-18]